MIQLSTIAHRNEEFCERTLGDETIFLSPDGQQVHALNAVGTDIWAMIDGSATFAEIRDRICVEYDVPSDRAERDLLAFANELATKHLLILESA